MGTAPLGREGVGTSGPRPSHAPQRGKPRLRKAGLHIAASLHLLEVTGPLSYTALLGLRMLSPVYHLPGGLCPWAPEGDCLSFKGLSSPDRHGGVCKFGTDWLPSALRGFFQAGSAVHLIEPLDGAGEEGRHALYRAEHLQQKAGTCGVSDSSLEKALGPRISAAFRPRVSGCPHQLHHCRPAGTVHPPNSSEVS